jgi:L-asparaginase
VNSNRIAGEERGPICGLVMRNPTLAGPEASATRLAAVQVAAAPSTVGMGATVVLNDEIHAARFARKTHTSARRRSATEGPIGWVVEGVRVSPYGRRR